MVPILAFVVLFACTFIFFDFNNSVGSQELHVNKGMKRIVFVSPQTDFPVWLQAKDGFDAAAEEFGFYGIWTGGGNCDINDMLREIDIAVAEEADAIITCPLNPNNFTSKFDEIMALGIPLVTINVDAALENQRTAYVGSDFREMGFKQADALYKKINGPMRIGIIMSNLDTRNQMIMVSSLRSYISTIPNAEIVAIDEDWSDPVIGIAVLSKMLSEHPEINAIFGTEGGGVSGFGKVVRDKELQDELTIIGVDIIQDNLDAIKSKSIYGVLSQDYYAMGYLAGKYAYENSMGLDVPSYSFTNTELVTLENVNNVVSIK